METQPSHGSNVRHYLYTHYEKWINNPVFKSQIMLFIFEMVVSRRYKEQFFPLDCWDK
jgi:hypothetical protein